MLILAVTAALGLVCLVTVMAAKRWGLTAAAAVGSALSGSAMHLMLDGSTSHPSRLDELDEWVIPIDDRGRVAARTAE